MKHETHKRLVQVDLLLGRGASDMEGNQLFAFHLFEGVLEDGGNKRIITIQVDFEDLEEVVFSLTDDKDIVGVSQESCLDDSNALRKLVPLYKLRVERIVNVNPVVPVWKPKVRPIKADGEVVTSYGWG